MKKGIKKNINKIDVMKKVVVGVLLAMMILPAGATLIMSLMY